MRDDPTRKIMPNGARPPGDEPIRAQLMKGSSEFHPDYRGIRTCSSVLRGLPSTSPPPIRAATVISLMMRVKIFPRLASAAPFLMLGQPPRIRVISYLTVTSWAADPSK